MWKRGMSDNSLANLFSPENRKKAKETYCKHIADGTIIMANRKKRSPESYKNAKHNPVNLIALHSSESRAKATATMRQRVADGRFVSWNKGKSGYTKTSKLSKDQETNSLIMELYVHKNITPDNIGMGFGCSRKTISRRLVSLGVSIKPLGSFIANRLQTSELIGKRITSRRGNGKTWNNLTPERREEISLNAIERLRKNPSLFKKGKSFYVTGRHLSPKTGKTMFFRSSFEKKYMVELDNNVNVVWYEYEPKNITLKYEWNGTIRNYKPDFLVTYSNGDKRLVEVKNDYHIKFERNQAKLGALVDFAKTQNDISGCDVIGFDGEDRSDKKFLSQFSKS